MVSAYPRVLMSVLASIIKTIFAFDAILTTNRTAVFLMFFLVIHVAGNCLVFFGPEVFNAYGHVLHVNPLLKLIEGYLLLATIFHAIGGLLLTYRRRKFILKGDLSTVLSNAKMAISSMVVLGFICVHLVQFRFGAWYDYLSTIEVTLLSESGVETVPKGTSMRDLYRLEKEVFSNAVNVWGYVAAIAALGAHLWWGWAKAVTKLGLEKRDLPAAEAVGKYLCIAPVIAAFIVQPIYCLYFLK